MRVQSVVGTHANPAAGGVDEAAAAATATAATAAGATGGGARRHVDAVRCVGAAVPVSCLLDGDAGMEIAAPVTADDNIGRTV